jgi:hypothetical protein
MAVQNLLLRLTVVGDNVAMQTNPPDADPLKHNRRGFQFSLRALLIGVTLLALPCGYVGWKAEIVRQRRSLLTLIVSSGGGYYTTEGDQVYFPVGSLPKGGAYFPDPFIVLADRHPNQEPSKIRRWLGDEYIDCIWIPKSVSSADASRIAGDFPEACVCQDRGRE